MAEILLEMKNITKTFPGVKALDNVNLQVNSQSFIGGVDKNGVVNKPDNLHTIYVSAHNFMGGVSVKAHS